MRRWAFIGLMTLALPVFAQQTDSIQVQADTTVAQPPVATTEPQPAATTAQQPKKNVYQGTTLRVDILNPILDLAFSQWHTYSVEAAVSVRLINRLFPTIEFGHAGNFLQEKDAAVPLYDGWGEYARIGLDINPLKKHPESRSVLLIGVRAGTGWQNLHTPALLAEQPKGVWIADVWGEVLAGVQVNIVKGFNMGWTVRMKYLFTKNNRNPLTTPYYIPGYGTRGEMNWGFDYYLGYTF